MTIKITKQNRGSTIKFSDELTIFEVSDLTEKLNQKQIDFSQDILLDLEDLHDIDTAGIQLLLCIKKNCQSNAAKITIKAVSEDVSQKLQLFSIDAHIPQLNGEGHHD